MVTQIAEARTQLPKDQYVQVGSIRTRFWQVGDEGRNVVLIHGLGSAVESWWLNVFPLAEHHRVFAMDLPGNGRSDKPKGGYSIPYFVKFVKDFMETLHLERASLIGESLGGMIALRFAEVLPEKVEKLILADPAGLSGKGINLAFRLLALPLIPELLTRPSRQVSVISLRSLFYDHALVTDDFVDWNLEILSYPGAQAGFLAIGRSLFSFGGMRPEALRPIVDNLGSITAPTLVLWGKQDRSLPFTHAKVAEERIPNVRVHLFDRCGHMPEIECATEFNKMALEFLAS